MSRSKNSQPVDFYSARLRAVHDNIWLWQALMSARPVEREAVPRASVDEHWRIYWNREWFAKLTIEQGAAVAEHEIWHPLRFHFVRARHLGVKPSERYIWGMAIDAEIHAADPTILARLATIPDFAPIHLGSFDPPLEPGGTAETWFKELMSRTTTVVVDMGEFGQMECPVFAPVDGDMKPGTVHHVRVVLDGSGSDGHREPWEDSSPGDRVGKEAARAIAQEVARQVLSVKGRGNTPSDMVRWAEEVLSSQVDWRTVIRDRFQSAIARTMGNSFATYQRFSRRTPSSPRILNPGFESGVPSVASIVDTSGSVSDKMLGHGRAEVTSLLASLGRKSNVVVYCCDAAASEGRQVHHGSEMQFFGGGGTDMRVAFDLIEADMKSGKHRFDLVVLMTDGYTPWPASFPVPVITMLLVEGDGNDNKFDIPQWMREDPSAVITVKV